MSRPEFRSAIVGALGVVLLGCGTTLAQGLVDSGDERLLNGYFNGFGTGVQYDIVNKAKAERRLDYLEAKRQRDRARCNAAAVERDNRQIDRDKYRIAVDEWLIRKNQLCDPGYYPVRTDQISYAAMLQVASPPLFPIPIQTGSTPQPTAPTPSPAPAVAAPTISLTIINTGSADSGVNFTVDGVAHQSAGGSRQTLLVSPDASITFDGGGAAPPQRYRALPGTYEFRLNADGWALYKLPDTPK